MTGLIFLLIVYVIPCIISARVCNERNRNATKGVVVTIIFGWFGTLGLWLALKKRDPKTKMLY